MKLRDIVCIALLFCLIIPASGQRKPKPKGSVKQLKSRLGSVNQKKVAIKAAIKKTQRQAAAVISNIVEVDGQLNTIETKLDNTTQSLQKHKSDQATLASDLEKAAKLLEVKRVQAAKRMREIFKQGDSANILDLFLSENLGDLAMRKSVLERIAKRDRELFEQVQALKKRVADQKAEKDRLVRTVAGLLNDQKVQQGELKTSRHRKEGLLTELHSQAEGLRAQYAQLDQESSALGSEIRAIQAAAARRSGGAPTKYSGGGMAWPADGRQTSSFGRRFHPIFKEYRLHAGIDIGVGYGSSVRAASGGTVIICGSARGYGNRVVIDHGGGISTLYGHLSRISVSQGQKVSRGQRIASSGNSGYSTGPHLHFEVRKNGNPVNPRSYL
ncbi:MAG: peptidoglycan DD-metalloendopeptidase family protein [Armatimonadetes bacterium]|nr:peptidoglycan DD-metalloendopeptidase family protein [Armatimonadota bacterium]